jgi:hypothetical protein
MRGGRTVDTIKARRYFQLKKKQKEIEQELSELRSEIMAYCTEQGLNETDLGNYKVRIIDQERKEYDDNKLYEALPDPQVWRLMSKADPAKISGLIKMNVITEEAIKDTYVTKKVSSLLVDKK